MLRVSQCLDEIRSNESYLLQYIVTALIVCDQLLLLGLG